MNTKHRRRMVVANALALVTALALSLSALPVYGQTSKGTKAPEVNTKKEKKVEVKELDAKTFDRALADAEMLVLVDFTAYWCGPCQLLKPKLDQLAKEFDGKIVFVKVEVTKSPSLAQRYGVTGYPTLKLIAPGGKTVVSTSVGNKDTEVLRSWLQAELEAHAKSLESKDKSIDKGNTPAKK